MAQTYFAVLTNAGNAAVAKAVAEHTPLTISSMAFGDGNGATPTPNITATNLAHEVYRVGIDDATRDATNQGHVVVTATIPITAGPFWVREVGLYLSDGTFFAVGNFPDTYVPAASDGAVSSIVVKMVIVVSQSAQVQISISNSTGATQTFVYNALQQMKVAVSQMLRPPFVAVNSVSTATPPANPVVGDVYGVPAGATGVWAGKDGQFAQYVSLAGNYPNIDSAGWVYATVPHKTVVGAQDSGLYYERIYGTGGPWRSLWSTGQEAKDGVLADKWISPATLRSVITDTLVTQAQARTFLQIYPEVLRSDYLIPLTISAGKVVISTGTQFLHRGMFVIDTSSFTVAQRTFSPSLPNWTYHLRWYAGGAPNPVGNVRFPAATYPNGGFILESLGDTSYVGPGNWGGQANADISPVFDSTYDSMLIAKITTDANGIINSISLKNKHQLGCDLYDYTTDYTSVANGAVTSQSFVGRRIQIQQGDDCAYSWHKFNYNWARTPNSSSAVGTTGCSNPVAYPDGSTVGYFGVLHGVSGYVTLKSVNRYWAGIVHATDWYSVMDSYGNLVSYNFYASCRFSAEA